MHVDKANEANWDHFPTVQDTLERWNVLPQGSSKDQSDGPDRFLDGLRGTTSKRVLRKSNCPVAVIEVESVAE